MVCALYLSEEEYLCSSDPSAAFAIGQAPSNTLLQEKQRGVTVSDTTDVNHLHYNNKAARLPSVTAGLLAVTHKEVHSSVSSLQPKSDEPVKCRETHLYANKQPVCSCETRVNSNYRNQKPNTKNPHPAPAYTLKPLTTVTPTV